MNEKIVIRAEKILGTTLRDQTLSEHPELDELFRKHTWQQRTFDKKVVETISSCHSNAKLIFDAIGKYREKRIFSIRKDHLLAFSLDIMVPISLQNTVRGANSDDLISFIRSIVGSLVGSKNILKIDFENNSKNTYLRLIIFPCKKDVHQGKFITADETFRVFIRELTCEFNEKLEQIAQSLGWIEDSKSLEAITLFDIDDAEDD